MLHLIRHRLAQRYCAECDCDCDCELGFTKWERLMLRVPASTRIWIGTHLPGRWRWHTFDSAEAFLRSLEDDDA